MKYPINGSGKTLKGLLMISMNPGRTHLYAVNYKKKPLEIFQQCVDAGPLFLFCMWLSSVGPMVEI